MPKEAVLMAQGLVTGGGIYAATTRTIWDVDKSRWAQTGKTVKVAA